MVTASGQVLIKLDFLDGNLLVAKDIDKNAKALGYPKTGIGLNQVAISSWQLRRRNGSIQKPLKPFITFSTSVIGQGKKKAILTLDFLGNTLIKQISQNCPPTTNKCTLVDSQGFWLKGETSDRDWSEFLSDRTNQIFNQKFSDRFPLAWQKISTQTSGQFQTQDGIFTFNTICIDSTNTRTCKAWKLISRYPSISLAAKTQTLAYSLLALYGASILVIGFVTKKFISDRRYRQKVEQDILQTAAKYEQLYNKAPCGYHSLDSRLVYININDTELAMPGCSRNEVIGKLKFINLLTQESMNTHIEY